MIQEFKVDTNDIARVMKKLTDLGELFEQIRDNPDATLTITGLADRGESRVENLQAVLHSVFDRSGREV